MTMRIADIQILATAQQHRFTQPFSYQVPAALPTRVGDVVFVPLSNRIVTGIVIAVGVPANTHTTMKPIMAHAGIQLLPEQLQFAQWLTRFYACYLADALALCLPQQLILHPQRHWYCTEAGYAVDVLQLPSDEREVLYEVRQNNILRESALEHTFRATPASIRNCIKLLMARGYLGEHYQLATPVPQRTRRMITLVDDTQPRHRAPHQAAIVTQLQHAPARTLPAHTFQQKAALKRLLELGIVISHEEPIPAPIPPPLPEAVTLTPAQQGVVDIVTDSLGRHQTFLVDGVTGSGKTEVYCAAIRAVIARQHQTLVLIPEIALTTQLAKRFETRFPGRVVLLHGQLTAAQRVQRWHDIRAGHYDVIIGPRSALFAPIPRLGLIVIDEEHDSSYKSDAGIRYHARDSAIMYAKIRTCPVLLGSATPSVEVIAASQEQRIVRLVLPERVDHNQVTIPRPPIRVVDLRTEASIDPHGLIGVTLAERIRAHVDGKHHVLLLLNRRGSVSARICRQCSATDQCPHCSAPLVVHQTHRGAVGICHSCGKSSYVNEFCSQCFHNEFLDIGSGTQRLTEVIQHHWPTTPVVRWDSDTADTAHAHAQLLNQIESHPCTIIVGTQMIAKGFDIANIRLVGVVNTDTALHLPDIRAAERTYQLLTQVAGRAGRRAGDAEVIFQTYKPDHYAIQAAARYDDQLFYTQELQYRQRMQYPPYTRFIKLVYRHTDAQRCEALAIDDIAHIQTRIAAYGAGTRIIGPAPCFFRRIRNRYRWQAIIATQHPRGVLSQLIGQTRATIDVDPQSLL